MKINQTGRSMIEMLGVLAIVGVLTTGGIAGYSEAMRKYKMNKTIEIVRDSLVRLRELEDIIKINDYLSSNSKKKYIDYELLPEQLCNHKCIDVYGDDGTDCEVPVGSIWLDIYFSNNRPMSGSYLIYFRNGNIIKNCIEFLSHHWEKETPSEWWTISKNNSYNFRGGYISVFNEGYEQQIYAGKGSSLNEDDGVVAELSMNNIANACNQLCNNVEWCATSLNFRESY